MGITSVYHQCLTNSLLWKMAHLFIVDCFGGWVINDQMIYMYVYIYIHIHTYIHTYIARMKLESEHRLSH